MSIYEMTTEQVVENIAKGIEGSFKAAIKLELEKQAAPIIEATAERLASGIVASLKHYREEGPFTKNIVVLKIDGVEKELNK